jgi:hypothetical protein
MNGLGTAHGLLPDMFLIIVTMSVLDWRESRWSRRTDAQPAAAGDARRRLRLGIIR